MERERENVGGGQLGFPQFMYCQLDTSPRWPMQIGNELDLLTGTNNQFIEMALLNFLLI